jgi:hypothetical protein
MQNQTIGQMQSLVHAQQLAMDGMAMSKDLGGLRCPGIIRGGDGAHPGSRQAVLPTGINEGIARPHGARLR